MGTRPRDGKVRDAPWERQKPQGRVPAQLSCDILVRSSNCDSKSVSCDRQTHCFMHVYVSFLVRAFLTITTVALHVTTRPKFEL